MKWIKRDDGRGWIATTPRYFLRTSKPFERGAAWWWSVCLRIGGRGFRYGEASRETSL